MLVWGTYEEQKTAQGQEKVKILDDRYAPLLPVTPFTGLPRTFTPPQSVEKKLKAVYFRIKILEKPDKFEKTE